MSLGDIDYKLLADQLRGELNQDIITELFDYIDIQTWTSPSSLSEQFSYDLNKFYRARLTNYTPPSSFPSTVQRPVNVDVNQFWNSNGYIIPAGYYNFLATYSKASLLYPIVSIYTKLPDLSSFPNGTVVYFGFEPGGGAINGIASFRLQQIGTPAAPNVVLYANYGIIFGAATILADITSRRPANYTTAANLYVVKLNQWGAEWFINSNLVAVALDIPEAPLTTIATAPPYAIMTTPRPVAKRTHTLLEIGFPYPTSTNIQVNPGPLTFPLDPNLFRWASDVPNPPRAYRLYQNNSTTLMAGASISSGSLSSHPFPLYGYRAKTILFRANGAGTLTILIRTLSGNWITYDTVSVSANTLVKYSFTTDAVVGQIQFTPSAYPTTINDAELILIP